MSEKVNIELIKAEALVLFEFLRRLNEAENPNTFEDQAEERVLQDIKCILEKGLNTPFNRNYKEILKNARASVRVRLFQ